MAEAADPRGRGAGLRRRRPRAQVEWAALRCDATRALRGARAGLAGRHGAGAGAGTCRIWSACTRMRRVRRGDSSSWRGWPPAMPSRERFLTELTLDPPEATSDQAGPPLLDEDYLILSTIHSAKGQEWTVGARAQRGRRLHPVPTWPRAPRRARGGAPAALRRDDPRERSPAPPRAAALLHPQAGAAIATSTRREHASFRETSWRSSR